MKQQASVLLFEMTADRTRQIRKLCRELDISVVCVSAKDYVLSLGELAEIDGFRQKNMSISANKDIMERLPVKGITEEMLVMSGMDSQRIDTFLEAWKKAGLAPVALKAVLTPGNIFWNPHRLFSELNREHALYHSNA